MQCPVCLHEKSRIVKSEHGVSEDGDVFIVRRRECCACAHRFSTFECYEIADVEASMKLRAIAQILSPA